MAGRLRHGSGPRSSAAPSAAARRIGKLLLLDTDGGPTLGLRFGMTGGLVVDGNEALDRLRYGPGVFNEKWVRARFTFDDGGELLMHDPRRFGSLELAPDESRLGPDALTVSLGELRAALAIAPGRSGVAAPLKARFMDQERLAGVGNLLADEILWRAGLAPGRRTPLTDAELRELHKQLRSTLRQLGRRGGSHMGDLMEERDVGARCPRRRDGAAPGDGGRADDLLVPARTSTERSAPAPTVHPVQLRRRRTHHTQRPASAADAHDEQQGLVGLEGPEPAGGLVGDHLVVLGRNGGDALLECLLPVRRHSGVRLDTLDTPDAGSRSVGARQVGARLLQKCRRR